jgi:hypothetical protein
VAQKQSPLAGALLRAERRGALIYISIDQSSIRKLRSCSLRLG